MKYDEVDARLVAQIGCGENTFAKLCDDQGLMCLARKVCPPEVDVWRITRVIDRRLQAMRKAGRIRFDGKVWVKVKGGAA